MPELAPPPWQVNAVSDNVVYTLVMGVPLDDSVGQFPFLSALLAGAASSGGQAHLRFPSDTFPLCRADSRFVIRAREEEESEPVRARRWRDFFREEVSAIPFLLGVAGSHARLQIGGRGVPRWLGIYPQPVPRCVGLELKASSRAKRGASFDVLGAVIDGRQQVVELSNPPSAAGNMFVFALPHDASYDTMGRICRAISRKFCQANDCIEEHA